MGVIVNFVEEVRSRLNTAIAIGGDLSIVKVVQVGTREEARKNNNWPIINITVSGGIGDPVYKRNGNRDEITLNITLIANKKGDKTNKLFKTSDSTGVLYTLETMLNVIEKNTSGTVDMNFNSTVATLREYSFTVDESNDGIVEIDVELTAQTVDYQLGSR